MENIIHAFKYDVNILTANAVNIPFTYRQFKKKITFFI